MNDADLKPGDMVEFAYVSLPDTEIKRLKDGEAAGVVKTEVLTGYGEVVAYEGNRVTIELAGGEVRQVPRASARKASCD